MGQNGDALNIEEEGKHELKEASLKPNDSPSLKPPKDSSWRLAIMAAIIGLLSTAIGFLIQGYLNLK